MRSGSAQGRSKAGQNTFAIVRVEISFPPVEGRLDIFLQVAKERLDRLIPDNIAGGDVLIPERVVSRFRS